MGRSRVSPEQRREVRDLLASGMNPNQAARRAGVSAPVAYRLDQKMTGVARAALGEWRSLPPERARRVADLLASGMTLRQAAGIAGVSRGYVCALNKKMGGVYRPPGASYSDRYLDREERYEIARLRESGLTVRKVAACLGRSPSTVSRELARNADPRSGRYQPERAHRLAWERQ
ncbi:MAG TPA: helix-turn-helix domain-containing protein, partial [Streptosporangiaceae bacterium]|nr:helix-turn-helix domain-containing protein [Streptosporangiaceae bacterium]